MIDEIIKLIDAYWKFDNDQQHLSTWHDKQDLIEAVKQVKNCNAPAVSKSEGLKGRELLLAFANWLREQNFTCDLTSDEEWVDGFLSQQ